MFHNVLEISFHLTMSPLCPIVCCAGTRHGDNVETPVNGQCATTRGELIAIIILQCCGQLGLEHSLLKEWLKHAGDIQYLFAVHHYHQIGTSSLASLVLAPLLHLGHPSHRFYFDQFPYFHLNKQNLTVPQQFNSGVYFIQKSKK